MSFGGNAGAAAALLDIGAIAPNPGSISNQYVGNDIEYTGPGGAHASGAPDRVNTIVTTITTPLAAYADGTVDGSAADTGVLVTAQAAANEHGLPANFGAGRGNWNTQDFARVSVDALTTETTPSQSQPDITVIAMTIEPSGDLRIVFKNKSTDAPEALTIKLRYDHSITY